MSQIDNYIAYVEDDEDDVWVFKESFTSITDISLKIFKDGVSFLKHLSNNGTNLPCLTISDINLPGLNGIEMLQMIRENTLLVNMPIVMFSTSTNPKDVENCRKYNVDLITKPIEYNQWKEAARQLMKYCEVDFM